MDLGIILIVVVLLAVPAIAVLLFIRSPDEDKFKWFSAPKPQPGSEYAPEYTSKEKFIKLGVHLLWLVPLFWLIDVKIPAFMEAMTQDLCVQWFGFNAMTVVMGFLVWSPVFLITPVLLILWRHWRRVEQTQQHPLPGQKVYKPTPYIRGQLACKRARLILKLLPFVGLFCLILSAMMHLTVNQLMPQHDDPHSCPSVSQEND